MLCGTDRATGEGAETFEDADEAMVGEDENDVEYLIPPAAPPTQPSTSSTIESHQKKRRKDPLVAIVVDIASSLKEYMNLKKKPSGQEIYEVVSTILGLSQQEIFKAVQLLLNGDPEQFYLLKSLPDDKKYDWLAFLLSSDYADLLSPPAWHHTHPHQLLGSLQVGEPSLGSSRNAFVGFTEPSSWVSGTQIWVPRRTQLLGSRNPDLGSARNPVARTPGKIGTAYLQAPGFFSFLYLQANPGAGFVLNLGIWVHRKPASWVPREPNLGSPGGSGSLTSPFVKVSATLSSFSSRAI
ncbi:hypothetical protein SLEP1_g37639 [Rubroshorea leprosula]|uniref:Uncharacterized protein n=1 Tax=Rubroshorea leprosula TaxID=152421 RepID=A0AAV5KVQ1_9ROSI|nr:hypothetical protein SLEP1_g37639 [Rubroshorea leprosula]